MNHKTREKPVIEGIKIILFRLGNLKSNEDLCIVSDNQTLEIGDLFYEIAKNEGISVIHLNVKPLSMHGEEPPRHVADAMKESNLVVGLTKYSMAHTNARYIAANNGVRYLSLPDYSMEILAHESLRVDFEKSASKAKDLSDKFTTGKKIQIKTEAGTNIQFDISGRSGNFAPGYVREDLLLGSPPDIEANIAPIENNSDGIVVVDGSIPIAEIGLLRSPITLRIERGNIISMEGDPVYLKFLNGLFDKFGPKSRVLAEVGVGFNEKAKLCGNMLIDEGCHGTFHFGFGSNSTIGGMNKISFHLDFIFYANEMFLDNHHLKI